MTEYKRQYRYKPKPETVRGWEFVKVMLLVFAMTFGTLVLWITTT